MSKHAELLGIPSGFVDSPECLIYGIGNAGREDDGLGWAFIDRLEGWPHTPRACLRRTYQLNLEDADLISRYARVLFVDATKDAAVDTFAVTRPEPKLDFSFTSHSMSVPTILATAQQCFERVPDAYLLAIRGYQWELRQGLTTRAQQNLGDALRSVSHSLTPPPLH
jgi:hydrogenase maturation protease